MKTIIKALLLICTIFFLAAAEAEIYRCTDENGNMVFGQFPCEKEEAVVPDEKTEPAPEETATVADTDDVVSEAPDEAAVTACKKPFRDAIDAIEARMLKGYTPDQGEAYKKQLLGLTRQMRRCEV